MASTDTKQLDFLELKDQKSDPDSSSSESESKANRRYNLRLCSQVNRVLVERRKEEPKRPKPKSRPPPLSKYRRKTANSRERVRMNEINDAFEDLRKVIPDYPSGKMTKITTLRLALNYMAALREMLGYSNESDYRNVSISSPETSSSSDGGSTGSVSDCSSPEPCTSSNAANNSDENLRCEGNMDFETDTSLHQLFELKLDSSLSAPLDTSLDDVFPQASPTADPPDSLFTT